MRLHKKEIETIRHIVHAHAGEVAIYLFGSRLDDEAEGGDIDLYIADFVDLPKRAKIKWLLQERLGKPVDIVVHRDFDRPIEQAAMKGVRID